MTKIDRRGFFATLFAVIAAWFTPKPTTTLGAASLTLDEFNERYLRPALEAFNRSYIYDSASGMITVKLWPPPPKAVVFFVGRDGVWEMSEAVFQGPRYGFQRLSQFHSHAMTLTSDPLTKDQVDYAIGEINAMQDELWADEPWPEVKAFIQS